MDLVSLQIEIYRAQFAINKLMDWLNEDLHSNSQRMERPQTQARIQRAHDRLMRSRQDLAAIANSVWPDDWPHPGAPEAPHHYGFPRETKREAPYSSTAELFETRGPHA